MGPGVGGAYGAPRVTTDRYGHVKGVKVKNYSGGGSGGSVGGGGSGGSGVGGGGSGGERGTTMGVMRHRQSPAWRRLTTVNRGTQDVIGEITTRGPPRFPTTSKSVDHR